MLVLGQHWANTLRQYWPNAEPLLPQHWANTACRYWASTGPVHCASTGPMLDQHWPNTGAVPHASIGPIHSRCAAYVLGQCRLYRHASTGPILSCLLEMFQLIAHTCWQAISHYFGRTPQGCSVLLFPLTPHGVERCVTRRSHCTSRRAANYRTVEVDWD